MKTLKIICAAGLLIAAASIISAFTNAKKFESKASAKAYDDKGFAVVELFTSEGCSSCPSADAVIEKLNKEITDKPVYILAYHVDYWDRGGWKDVFSSAAYSTRQYNYASWFRLSSVYTPQVVVNGKTEFVGSQEGTLRNAIASDLKKNAKITLNLDHAITSGDKVSLNYHVSDGNNVQLVAALVQPYAQVSVKGGENGGRTLSHVQIVRQLEYRNLNQKQGTINLEVPRGADIKNWEIIGFLQDISTGEILGATKTNL
jgi:hypothetical protein